MSKARKYWFALLLLVVVATSVYSLLIRDWLAGGLGLLVVVVMAWNLRSSPSARAPRFALLFGVLLVFVVLGWRAAAQGDTEMVVTALVMATVVYVPVIWRALRTARASGTGAAPAAHDEAGAL
jgi:hypothetical protein